MLLLLSPLVYVLLFLTSFRLLIIILRIQQAALNSKSPWLTPFGRESEADAVKRSFKVENSDFCSLYNAYTSWREACGNGYEREFCRVSFIVLFYPRIKLICFLIVEIIPFTSKSHDD